VKRLFTLSLAHVPRLGEPVARLAAGPQQQAPVRRRLIRDPASAANVVNDHEWSLVQQLASPDWRLLVTGEKDGIATAEVAHEILLTTWPALKRWLEEEREFLIWRGEIEPLREQYAKAVRAGPMQRRRALLTGLQLDTARKWLDQRRRDISPAIAAFIEASARADRANARRWLWLQGAVVLSMLAVIASLLAYINQAFLQEQYHRQFTIGLRVLTAAEEKEKASRPGPETTFKECANGCPTMVVVPAGNFIMGSPEGRGESNEWPAHEVTIANPLAVGRTEVTYAEWDVCVAAGACPKISDNGWGRGDRPVILVSWEEAKGYVTWLKRMTGKDYRLLWRPSGNTRRELATRGAGRLATMRLSSSTMLGSKTTPWARRGQWPRRNPTPSVFMTCMATSGSGSRTPIIIATTARHRTEPRGFRVVTTVAVWFAAVPGMIVRRISPRPIAAGAPPDSEVILWDFVSRGRSPREVVRGRYPGVEG
jgi:hypothetical protein